MPYLEVSLKIPLQLYILEFVSVVHLKELQLDAFLKLDCVIPRSIVWQPLYIFSVER